VRHDSFPCLSRTDCGLNRSTTHVRGTSVRHRRGWPCRASAFHPLTTKNRASCRCNSRRRDLNFLAGSRMHRRCAGRRGARRIRRPTRHTTRHCRASRRSGSPHRSNSRARAGSRSAAVCPRHTPSTLRSRRQGRRHIGTRAAGTHSRGCWTKTGRGKHTELEDKTRRTEESTGRCTVTTAGGAGFQGVSTALNMDNQALTVY
jgi:hypothetical protein